jgi:hypothetical protein
VAVISGITQDAADAIQEGAAASNTSRISGRTLTGSMDPVLVETISNALARLAYTGIGFKSNPFQHH